MVELNTVSFSFVIRIHCCPVKIFLWMRFPACGRQVSLHFISLPMTASFLGTLTFQSQRYYVGLWKVQLPILSFIHYSHSKKWMKSQNDNTTKALSFRSRVFGRGISSKFTGHLYLKN